RALESAQQALTRAPNPVSVNDDTEDDDDIITPPPGDTTEEDRGYENEARKYLVADGCPPCYPPEVDFPFRDPPKEHREIISYWEWSIGTGRCVLDAQVHDWRGFRNLQWNNRQRYRRRPFQEYEAKVCRQREKYGEYGNVRLRPDLAQQSHYQNWIEFQYYHFWEHDLYQGDVKKLLKEQEDSPQEEEFFQSRLNFLQQRCQKHELLLRWIEKELHKMAARLPPSTDGDDHHQSQANEGDASEAAQKSPTPVRRKRVHTKGRAVLGVARVSKPEGQQRSTRSNFKALAALYDTSAPPPAIEQSTSSPYTGSKSRITTTPRRGMSRHARERALRQLHPQRVVKAKAKKSPPVPTQPHKHRQSPPQPSWPATELQTRSGRVSRVPIRWAPGAW
ncbi:MAG: hypothetical protein M1817_006317, partial [Caeruleum heppii]